MLDDSVCWLTVCGIPREHNDETCLRLDSCCALHSMLARSPCRQWRSVGNDGLLDQPIGKFPFVDRVAQGAQQANRDGLDISQDAVVDANAGLYFAAGLWTVK